MQLVYTGTKLETKFNVKDKTKKEHHHDLLTVLMSYEKIVLSRTMVKLERD